MRGRMRSDTSRPLGLRPGKRRRPHRPALDPGEPVGRWRRQSKQRTRPQRWLRARQGGCGCLRP
eukprot:11643276-Alexandrium_andersonii.AAC.1